MVRWHQRSNIRVAGSVEGKLLLMARTSTGSSIREEGTKDQIWHPRLHLYILTVRKAVIYIGVSILLSNKKRILGALRIPKFCMYCSVYTNYHLYFLNFIIVAVLSGQTSMKIMAVWSPTWDHNSCCG